MQVTMGHLLEQPLLFQPLGTPPTPGLPFQASFRLVMSTDKHTHIKDDLRDFYRKETAARNTENWLKRGGTARVPESKSAHYFVERIRPLRWPVSR